MGIEEESQAGVSKYEKVKKPSQGVHVLYIFIPNNQRSGVIS